MKMIETVGRFVPGLNVALEIKKSLNPEVIKRRAAILGVGALALSAAGTGIFMSGMNKPNEQHTMTMDGGEATVKSMDRNLAELHVVGFQTGVDGVWVEDREGGRKALGVPLPDITHELLQDGRLIDSDLCIKGGDKSKDITETVIDGVRHVDYVIDPADISVCSRESVNSLVISREDGNWITNINDADKNLRKLGKDAEGQKNSKAIEDENQQRAKMARIAKNLALQTVNRQCGPKVFEVTKEDVLDRIEDLLGRDGEVFTAKYPDGLTEVTIEGKSEVDKFFEELPSQQEPGKAYAYEIQSMGECKISPEAMNERVLDNSANGAVAGR